MFWFFFIYFRIEFQLFDFEVEVEPVLDVLVGKTIEQAITECLEEEELANARKQVAVAAEVRAHAAASARHRQKHLLKLHNVKVNNFL